MVEYDGETKTLENPAVSIEGIEGDTSILSYNVVSLPDFKSTQLPTIESSDDYPLFDTWIKPYENALLNTTSLEDSQECDGFPTFRQPFELNEDSSPPGTFPAVFGRSVDVNSGEDVVFSYDPHLSLYENTLENPVSLFVYLLYIDLFFDSVNSHCINSHILTHSSPMAADNSSSIPITLSPEIRSCVKMWRDPSSTKITANCPTSQMPVSRARIPKRFLSSTKVTWRASTPTPARSCMPSLVFPSRPMLTEMEIRTSSPHVSPARHAGSRTTPIPYVPTRPVSVPRPSRRFVISFLARTRRMMLTTQTLSMSIVPNAIVTLPIRPSSNLVRFRRAMDRVGNTFIPPN